MMLCDANVHIAGMSGAITAVITSQEVAEEDHSKRLVMAHGL